MSIEKLSLPCLFWRIFPVCQSRRFPCFVRFNGFCYICQSWKFPCFVRFRGFLLYVYRGDFPALSVSEDFCFPWIYLGIIFRKPEEQSFSSCPEGDFISHHLGIDFKYIYRYVHLIMKEVHNISM